MKISPFAIVFHRGRTIESSLENESFSETETELEKEGIRVESSHSFVFVLRVFQ